MPTPKLTNAILSAAILGFEEQKRRIDAQIAELRAMLSGGTAEPAATPKTTHRARRKMSAAGPNAIAEAQRQRWAARQAAPPVASKPQRKLSAAGKAAIVAALKKRWAAKKAAEAQPAAAKKAAAKQ